MFYPSVTLEIESSFMELATNLLDTFIFHRDNIFSVGDSQSVLSEVFTLSGQSINSYGTGASRLKSDPIFPESRIYTSPSSISLSSYGLIFNIEEDEEIDIIPNQSAENNYQLQQK